MLKKLTKGDSYERIKNATGHTKKGETNMEEQWISLNAFMKKRKIGYDTAMDMIEKRRNRIQKN